MSYSDFEVALLDAAISFSSCSGVLRYSYTAYEPAAIKIASEPKMLSTLILNCSSKFYFL